MALDLGVLGFFFFFLNRKGCIGSEVSHYVSWAWAEAVCGKQWDARERKASVEGPAKPG